MSSRGGSYYNINWSSFRRNKEPKLPTTEVTTSPKHKPKHKCNIHYITFTLSLSSNYTKKPIYVNYTLDYVD